MDIATFEQVASRLDGVRTQTRDGLLNCRYHGRLVARQLDDTHVVIRSSFELRELMLWQFPETFTVPPRYASHMMIVADLANGDDGAIEDAVTEAWRLQTTPDQPS
ncbi:MAG: hypothetical protein ACRDTM_08990 [Micromonosporaceae bacterium]